MLKHFHLTRRQWKSLLKWTFYSLLFLLVLVIQDVILAKHPLLEIKLHVVPLLIVCVCIREGPEGGGLFALLAALFWCLSGADYGNLSLAVVPIGSILAAVLCRAVLTVRFLPTLLSAFVISLLNETVIFVFKVVLTGLPLSNWPEILLPGLLLSMPALPLFYFAVKGIHKTGGQDDL